MKLNLSIIILAFNRKEEVLKTVGICLANNYLANNSEIIVVDNCSADGTFEAVEGVYGNKITLIRTEENIGIAGWNKGFEIARGKYFLVLDDDSHPESGIEAAIDYLNLNDTIGVLALNISGGAYTTETYPDFFEWSGFIGCGAIIRKEVYDKIGGFSEWLFIYTHEFEYGIRVIDAGYKIIFFKESSVIHRASVVHRTNQRLLAFSTRNELLIIDKYFPEHRSVSLAKGKLKLICNYVSQEGFKALPYVFQGFKKFREDRKKITVTEKVSAATQRYFESQFLPQQSLISYMAFQLPRSLFHGLRHALKGINK